MQELGFWSVCISLVSGNSLTLGNPPDLLPAWGEIPFILGTALLSLIGIVMLIYVIANMVKPKSKFIGDGLLMLADTHTALKYEKLIKSAGYQVKLVTPPPDMRRGCELALEISLAEQVNLEMILKANDADYFIRPLRKSQ